MARVIAWRIHHVAYVENLNPLVWSNFSTARMRPRLPSWMRSRKARPRLRYLLAMETTSRRLASMRASLASWPPRTSLRSAARWAVDSLATPASAASSRRAASLPATILSASSTSSAASSNFTLPISLRYMCTGSAADPVHMYLKEIGKVKLLDAALEVELAERIVAGNDAARRLAAVEAGEAKESSARRTSDRRLVRSGQEAKEALIEANLRLVVSIAKRYSNRGLAFLDLIQEGNLGLMRAVEKLDHTKGFKFSTYATWWIRQAI